MANNTQPNSQVIIGKCPLCDRDMIAGSSVNQHHLIPKSRRGKEQFYMHRVCHHKLHATFTEKEMEVYYHTWERLREHHEIEKFVKWVKKKPVDFYDRNENTRK